MIIDGKEYVLKSAGDKSNPFMECGKVFFIRTVTHYFTGRLIWVGEKELVLENACWIADTGRFSDFMKDSKTVNEAEMFPDDSRVIIGRGAIVDMVEYPSLITETK